MSAKRSAVSPVAEASAMAGKGSLTRRPAWSPGPTPPIAPSRPPRRKTPGAPADAPKMAKAPSLDKPLRHEDLSSTDDITLDRSDAVSDVSQIREVAFHKG